MKRYGMVTRLKPQGYEKYKTLHAAVWPDVLKIIKQCNIDNYSIYHRDGYLFSYFEYTGSDFDADMAKMAADPVTQKWWAECIPCLDPLAPPQPWAPMDELFHQD